MRISQDGIFTVTLREWIEALGRGGKESEDAREMLSGMPDEHPGKIIHDIFCAGNEGRIRELLPHTHLLRFLLKGKERENVVRVLGTLRENFSNNVELLDMINRMTARAYTWMKDECSLEAAHTVGLLRKTFHKEQVIQETVKEIVRRCYNWIVDERRDDAIEMLGNMGGSDAGNALMHSMSMVPQMMHPRIIESLLKAIADDENPPDYKTVKKLLFFFRNETGDRLKTLGVLSREDMGSEERALVIRELGLWLVRSSNGFSNGNTLFMNSMITTDEGLERKAKERVIEMLVLALGETDDHLRAEAAENLLQTKDKRALLFVDVFYRENIQRACEITDTGLLEKLAKSRNRRVAERAKHLLRGTDADITAPIKRIPLSDLKREMQSRNRIKS